VTEALAGFNMPVAWYGFFAPPGLNAGISAKLVGEIGRTVSSAEVRSRLTDASMSPLFTSGEGMINLIRDTAASYARIVRVAGIKLE
jgi:tripartite-type tricarboxylate transporter receptor subunit TctC